MPNTNVKPTVKNLDTIKWDKIWCLWKEKNPKPRRMIKKNNKDTAKSSKPVVGQMKKCDQIKIIYNFLLNIWHFLKRLLTSWLNILR